MSVQKAILPGLFFGILMLIGFANLMLGAPGRARLAHANQKAVGEVSASLTNTKEQTKSNNGECSISDLYPEDIRQWCSLIERYASENGVDPNLISAVMLQESGGHPDAYSKSGAVGLMQVMPRDGKAANFMCPKGPCFEDRPSMDELYDPAFNVAYGAEMLSELIQKYGDIREALRAYGPMDVGYYYADLVINIMNSHQ